MAQRRTTKVVSLDDRRGVKDAGSLETLCANPRCDVLFVPGPGPGRRKQYHSDECKKAALRDMRRLQAQLEQYRRAVSLVESRLAAYGPDQSETDHVDDSDPADTVSADDWARAREQVARVGGMARFISAESGEFAQDLLDLHAAIEPVVRRPSS